MDGVTNLGDTPIAGAAETITSLQKSGRHVYFMTNNSSRSRTHYTAKLKNFGIDTPIESIYTSAFATAHYLAKLAPGSTVFVVGEHGLAEELSAAGLVPVVDASTVPYTQIDYVVVGIDHGFTYSKLQFAHAALTRGHAQLIATNRDATYPTEDGEIPGGGSIVAAVVTASGREPVTIGKPERYAFDMILEASGATPATCVMVGDRLDTDIAAGNRLNLTTVLVLTGVTTRVMAENAPAISKPTTIIGTLPEILEIY